MYRIINRVGCAVLLLLPGILHAQSRLSLQAASATPVAGWQRMQVEHDDRVVWVSPIAAITASDIQQAHPEVRRDGYRVIAITFTDAGAQKARDFSIAQRDKLVALLVDSKLLWVPTVTAEIGKQSMLTGNTSMGLTEEEVARIMSILR